MDDIEWVQAPDGTWHQLDPKLKAARDQAGGDAQKAAAVAAAARRGRTNLIAALVVVVVVAFMATLVLSGK